MCTAPSLAIIEDEYDRNWLTSPKGVVRIRKACYESYFMSAVQPCKS